MMWPFKNKEQRSNQSQNVPISSSAILDLFGISDAAAGETVTTQTALGVPAIWCAVNFISSTMAALPLNVFKKIKDSREKMVGGLQTILHDAPTPFESSYKWRKRLYVNYLTDGRALVYIERDLRGNVANLFILDPQKTEIEVKNNAKTYKYDNKNTYSEAEIIDIAFMEGSDGVECYSPILSNKEAISMMIAVTKYGGRFFSAGGMPSFVLKTAASTPEAMKRAMDDLTKGLKRAAKDGSNTIPISLTEDLKALNNDPEKMQMVDTQRFCIEQTSRIFMLPPAFLHDLTHGTFSNTEQQGTQLVKYLIGNLANQFEQELNLKLFGRFNSKTYVELNLDGLLRGDFLTRMNGYSAAIQTAQLTPNEARSMENRPAMPNGNDLLIQGATVPIGSQNLNGVPQDGNGNQTSTN